MRPYMSSSPDLTRRTFVNLGEYAVEAAQAAKAGAKRDLGHRQIGAIDQALGPLDPRGLRDLRRVRADMFFEQPAQVSRPDAETRGQVLHAAVIERTGVDEAHGALDGGPRAFPCR